MVSVANRRGLTDISNLRAGNELAFNKFTSRGVRPNSSSMPASLAASQLAAVAQPLPRVDPQLAAEYKERIHQHLFQSEAAMLPPMNHLQGHVDITNRMRGILLDWVVEIHYRTRMQPETLHVAVNLIDRYVGMRPEMLRGRLQLSGAACLMVASKYEEIHPISVQDLVRSMDSTFTKDDVRDAEIEVLNALEFRVTMPTALQFLELYADIQRVPRNEKHFLTACYFLEVGIMDNAQVGVAGSTIAAASLSLANRLMKVTPWNANLVQASGLNELEVKTVARQLWAYAVDHLADANVTAKYKKDRYLAVAKLVDPAPTPAPAPAPQVAQVAQVAQAAAVAPRRQ